MFLTPFVDLGDSVEKYLGLPRSKPDEESQKSHHELEQMESGMVASKAAQPIASLKPRIICLSGNVKLGDNNLLSGSGGLGIGSGPLDQSKAYFEVHVEEHDTTVIVGAVGVHPNSIVNNYEALGSVPNSIAVPIADSLKPGDVIGVVVDISDFPPKVYVYLNENQTELKSVSSIVRGDVWPAIEIVSGSAKIVFERHQLRYLTQAKLARGVEAVMIARSII